jgi:hypothetical protein
MEPLTALTQGAPAAATIHTPTQAIFILPIPAPLFALLHLSGALAGLAFVALTDAPAFGRALRQLLG